MKPPPCIPQTLISHSFQSKPPNRSFSMKPPTKNRIKYFLNFRSSSKIFDFLFCFAISCITQKASYKERDLPCTKKIIFYKNCKRQVIYDRLNHFIVQCCWCRMWQRLMSFWQDDIWAENWEDSFLIIFFFCCIIVWYACLGSYLFCFKDFDAILSWIWFIDLELRYFLDYFW